MTTAAQTRAALHAQLLDIERQHRAALDTERNILRAAQERLKTVNARIEAVRPRVLLDDRAALQYQALILERGALHQTVALAEQTVRGAELPLAKATFKDQPGYDLHKGPKGKNRWMREVGEVGQDGRMDTTPSVAEIEAMPFDRARDAVANVIASKAFQAFATTNQDGEMPVAVLTERLQQELGASVKTVRLSRDDRDKQLRKSEQEGRNRYDLLQKMIDEGEVIQYREQAVSLYEYEAEWYQAAIRRTNAGDELYLKSLRRADREQLERDRKRGRVIQKRTGVD